MRLYLRWIIITYSLVTNVHAEVVTDGTLGHPVNLPGPNFQIDAKLGQQYGGNLFHSFQDFNLQNHEGATFSGPANVTNIISRVTGGNPSNIDGLIRSTIPNADLYFLNPYGIVFGKNAQLDVQGGFHVSTADYLKLQDGGRFEARVPSNSLLTVASVAAFGFLTNSPASLSLQGSQLSVLDGQTLSLTGGNLSLTGAQVNAPRGQVTLSSLAQTGEFALANPTLSGKGGIIELQNQSKVSTSGIGGGKVLIRAGQLRMDHSGIQSATLGDQDGKGIDIATSESITITGDVYAINAPTFGSGKAGNLQITTPILENIGGYIDTNSLGSGASGNIDVQANQVTLRAGGVIGATTFGSGDGGLIRITAEDSVTVAGHRSGDFNVYGAVLLRNFMSHINADSYNTGRTGKTEIRTSHLSLDEGLIALESMGPSNHDAQNILIEANSVTLKNGGFIASDTFSDHAGGNITLRVSGDLTIMGRKSTVTIFPPPFVEVEAMQSSITSSTLGKGSAGHITISANRLVIQEGLIISVAGRSTGHAGRIQITANELLLNPGGMISSSSGVLFGKTLFSGTGDGGEIQIEVAGTLRIQGRDPLGVPSNISSSTITTGDGGNVKIRANHLQLSDGGLITANSIGLGKAGNLMIKADTLEIFDDSQITTSAQRSGGGNIHVTVANQLYLHRGLLTTSVAAGQSSSGNITIENSQFIVLNQGQIKAQADEGRGGNIRIVAEQFIPSADSLISASSQKGISGEVSITALENNISQNLIVLGNQSLKADQIKTLCSKQRSGEKPNRFIVTPLARNQPSPQNDWQASSFKPKK